jgi:hypothetical protein
MTASTLIPSLNVIVPVGVPAPGAIALTADVNVTVRPCTEEIVLEANVVTVLARLTTRELVPRLPV